MVHVQFWYMFNIITRRTLNLYAVKYPEAAIALQTWYMEVSKAGWQNANELKAQYGNASIAGDNRVVFNICGNKYRLVVRINYLFRAIQIKWFGPHSEYDKIDVVTINYEP